MKSIMPLLSRLVIAAAMVTTGWVNCFVFVQISPDQAVSLQELDLQVHEDAAVDDETTVVQTTRGLHRIALVLHEKWPQLGSWGTLVAWGAGIAQLLTGILILVGLFSRIAAFVICCIMVMILFLVTHNINGMFSMNPFDWPLHHARFSQLLTKLCLLVLALGIVVGGPGMFSIDRFQAARHRDPDLSSGKGAN